MARQLPSYGLGVLVFAMTACATAAKAGNSASGQRLILVTYWGEDKVALVDINGDPGKEELWSVDVLKTAGCAKPYDVRVDARGSKAFVSCSGNDEVAVIDIVAQMVEWKVKTGRSPRDLQLFSNDQRLIVANSGSDTVSVVDVGTKKVAYDVPVGVQPYGVAVVRDGTALVTGWASGDLHILSLNESSGRETAVARVGLLPYTVVAPPPGNIAYVAANGDHAVVAVDVQLGKVIASQKVGRNPWSIATEPSGKYILVANNRSNDLALLNTIAGSSASFNVPTHFEAGAEKGPGGETARAPKNAAMTIDGKTGVFTDLANNEVVVTDLTSGAIKRVIKVGKAPYGIEFIRPTTALQ